VSSAVNIETPGKESVEKEQLGSPRPNPVALEVMVNVTGAKPSESAGSRDLFSEDTTTVLVFKDGAVIRLTAGVVVGQLLFLTNKKSNQEVVCQVLRKRSYKPTSCYVELLFTEEREDYWGVAFPEAKTGAPEFKIVEQVQAEETTADHPETPVLPRGAEEVDALKREVEALREQLAKLEKKNVEEAAANAMAEAAARKEQAIREAALQEAAKLVEAKPSRTPKVQTELASLQDANAGQVKAEEKPAEVKPELLMPAAKDKQESPRSVVGMTLPVWKMEKSPEEQLLEEEAAAEVGKSSAAITEEPAKEIADETLPKPELDFTNVPKKKKRTGRPPNFKARKAGLAAVLVLVTSFGVWYGKWWKYLPVVKKTAVVAPVSVGKTNAVTAPVGGVAPAPVGEKKEGTATEGAESLGGNGEAAVAKEKTPETDSPEVDKSGESVNPETGQPAETGVTAAAKKIAKREKVVGKKNGVKAEDGAAKTVEPVATDAPFVAAKLLKAASPVYPPAAMANYITGDVKAEVVVKASGRVGEVKVISGPKALREAAVEALKQYEYAPATQGGRAVESKADVVVKFWFNP
jgi:TonB family protein